MSAEWRRDHRSFCGTDRIWDYFLCSNKKVATVDSKGVVKGVKAGTATITVKVNGVTAKAEITVK